VAGDGLIFMLEIPFNAPLGGATRIFLDDASAPGGASAVAETLSPCDMYTLQGDAFSQVVRGDIALPYGLDDAICNMRILDALFKSGNSGRWEDVERMQNCQCRCSRGKQQWVRKPARC